LDSIFACVFINDLRGRGFKEKKRLIIWIFQL